MPDMSQHAESDRHIEVIAAQLSHHVLNESRRGMANDESVAAAVIEALRQAGYAIAPYGGDCTKCGLSGHRAHQCESTDGPALIDGLGSGDE